MLFILFSPSKLTALLPLFLIFLLYFGHGAFQAKDLISFISGYVSDLFFVNFKLLYYINLSIEIVWIGKKVANGQYSYNSTNIN